jgi:hypothetical protein
MHFCITHLHTLLSQWFLGPAKSLRFAGAGNHCERSVTYIVQIRLWSTPLCKLYPYISHDYVHHSITPGFHHMSKFQNSYCVWRYLYIHALVGRGQITDNLLSPPVYSPVRDTESTLSYTTHAQSASTLEPSHLISNINQTVLRLYENRNGRLRWLWLLTCAII